jgi:hypothetical protein
VLYEMRWREGLACPACGHCGFCALKKSFAPDWVRYIATPYRSINPTLQPVLHLLNLKYMARKKTNKKISDKGKSLENDEIKHEQLQLFAAFRDIWQAQVL